MKHKIQLNNITVKKLSSVGQRKHQIKKNKKAYEKHKIKRNNPNDTQNPLYKKVMRQSLISIAIVICVLTISSIDFKLFNDATRGIAYLVEYESSFDDVFSVFKGNIDAVPAISDSMAILIKPTKGHEIANLVDTDNKKIGKIYSVPDGICYSSADGVVFFVDKVSADNPYIRIRHDHGLDTLYMGIVADIDVGDSVTQGQAIGTSIGEKMGFVCLKNSKYTDSEPYMVSSQP